MEEYDEATACHYAAYRPPLHGLILRPVLGRLPRFDSALDIGCGAGHSTMALTAFAKEVTGTDPSKHMIGTAAELWGQKALFVSGAPQPFSWAFRHERFKLFALAGVLPYRDPSNTLNEIFSLVEREAKVVVYDFEVELERVHAQLGYRPSPSDYRHDVELPEHEGYNFKRQLKIRNRANFTVNPTELAHLLLSVKDFRLWAKTKFGDEGPHAGVVKALGSKKQRLRAKTWCSLFAFQR